MQAFPQPMVTDLDEEIIYGFALTIDRQLIISIMCLLVLP